MHPPHGLSPCTGNWSFTHAEQLDFVNATMVHLEQALSSMDAQGKTAIVSTEVTKDSSPLNASVFDAMLLRHGALHYNEFFQGSEEDVQTALKLVEKEPLEKRLNLDLVCISQVSGRAKRKS